MNECGIYAEPEELKEQLKQLPSGATPMSYADVVIRSVPSDWIAEIMFYLDVYIKHELRTESAVNKIMQKLKESEE